jgi:hypothetical protein
VHFPPSYSKAWLCRASQTILCANLIKQLLEQFAERQIALVAQFRKSRR